jgi:hypothetical protein
LKGKRRYEGVDEVKTFFTGIYITRATWREGNSISSETFDQLVNNCLTQCIGKALDPDISIESFTVTPIAMPNLDGGLGAVAVVAIMIASVSRPSL